MAHSFDELVEMQRAADAAQTQVEQLRDQYGPPTRKPWSEQQSETYETAWRAWRDLARDIQAAVTEHAAADVLDLIGRDFTAAEVNTKYVGLDP
ncbi:hypothetical protein [Streptomyces carpinensis]|uniref:Uncharacterized protein n=1 Tax=Streptomyces carpinensis TaxID=66369 RepID=A0ABV1W9H5_9ACTN|nr:hypothetical protein [Streptomyces carpinensis]